VYSGESFAFEDNFVRGDEKRRVWSVHSALDLQENGGCVKRTIGIALLILGLGTAPASAQEGFDINYMDVGPVVGFGNIAGAGASIGARVEKAIKDLPQANGVLGLQVGVDYYNYDFVFTNDSVTVIPITVMVNYHFKIPSQPKLDVFAGAGIGYQRVSVDFDCGPFVDCDFSDSGVFGVGHGGVRYFWRPKMAAYGEVGGGGNAAVHAGLMFKFGDN
jgi:hypothetical protein